MILKIREKNFLTELNTITKIIVSLIFSVIVVFLKKEISLLIIFLASIFYLLPLRKYKLMIISYTFILILFGISTLFTGALEKMMAKAMSAQSQVHHETIQHQEKSEVSTEKPKSMGHPGRNKEKISMTVPFLRTALMLNLVFALSLSSGIRKLTNVLKTIRLPRIIFLPTIVIFRFVPGFLHEMGQILENIKIKTAKPPVQIMFTNPKLYIRLLLIPSVVRSLKSAEELSAAAEMKGISGNKDITNSAPENWKFADVIILTITVALCIVAFLYENGAL